jgi:hypothetical protein
MARRTQTYAIRLAVEGGGQVKAELVSVGQSGEQSLKRIETAGDRASGGLKGLGRQAELLRTGIRTLGGALTHGNGALLAQVVLTRAVSFADDFAGARAYAGVTATAETVLDVYRNGSPIGTITFGIGASAGTFATAGGGAETFAAGDRLAIINQNPADATLADLSITFLGKRT